MHHKYLCDTFYLAAICVIDFIEFAISSTSFILPNIITFSSITYLCDYRGKGFELVPPRTTTIMETGYTHWAERICSVSVASGTPYYTVKIHLYIKIKSNNFNNNLLTGALSCFDHLLYKKWCFSKIQDYFRKSKIGHLFLSIFEKWKYFWELEKHYIYIFGLWP